MDEAMMVDSRAPRRPFLARLVRLLARRLAASQANFGISVLTESDEPVAPDHRFVVARGVVVDEATRRAASAHVRRKGLAVLDLVPGRAS
ncbi:hypothetical protein [Sorangium cellulosum]|uniref:hypothetical protein n=1 Tax=Sorangium cellulosum TaxID=56 RepID=UPI001E57BF53|nr:hypothetical protein [Sorangium cellulosum]